MVRTNLTTGRKPRPQAVEKPNLLLIWTDEQRFDTIRACGNAAVDTPNLDRLAQRSFVFDRTYCCQPVCTPSRGCILTGLWPHQHGARTNNVPLNPDAKTIAELIDPAYRRAYLGKWHLGDEISPQHGWDEWTSIEDGSYRRFYSDPAMLEAFSDYHKYLYNLGYPPDAKTFDGKWSYSRGATAMLPYRHTKAGFLGRETSRFLINHDRDQPFCLSVNFLEPHMPFFGPLNDHYNPDDLPVGPAFMVPPSALHALRNQANSKKYVQDGFEHRPFQTEAHARRFRANYLGLVTMVDRAVGEILDALDASGLAKNTIVVFTSDHGEMMGDHAMLAKTVMFEESARVPLLVHVPWIQSPQTHVKGQISQIDLVPTLLDLMHQPVPTHLMGRSRLAVLEGSRSLEQNDVFFIWDGGDPGVAPRSVAGFEPGDLALIPGQRWRCIVSHEGFKLNRCATDPRNELFDLNNDPHELNNLFTSPAHQTIVADLTTRLRAWQATIDDDCPLE